MDGWRTVAQRWFSTGSRFPSIWNVGSFEIEIAKLTEGRLDERAHLLRGARGTAWLRFPCARQLVPAIDDLQHRELSRFTHAVEAVAAVLHPQTEIDIAEARRLRPDAAIGETISLAVAVDRVGLQRIVELGRGVGDWLDADPRADRFAVEFSDLTINLEDAAQGVGRVIEGSVTYPVAGAVRRPIEIVIEGFVLVLSSLELSPRRSTAVARVSLPGGITDAGSCQPASIDLGQIAISPTCDFYVDAPDHSYGPWLLGDTGMTIEGTGYVLDLSTAASPTPWPPSWRGLALGAGTATGEKYVPDPCNTGYLRGHYTHTGAVVISTGFFGTLHLAKPVTFAAINPLGQTFTFRDGAMDVWFSRIVRGELKNGSTKLPVDAVCRRKPGQHVTTPISVVSIQPDLDLAGSIDHRNHEISWGELTRHGDEVVAWTGIFGPGYLYLPAAAVPSFSPVATGVFLGPALSSVPDASLAELEAYGVAGVAFPSLSQAFVFSPDRPGGRRNPIKLGRLQGWIRIGITGVDGALSTYLAQSEDLGDPKSTGYVGKVPFRSTLFANDRKNLLAEFVSSASFDSNFAGSLAIPAPSDIPQLGFAQMKLTSTACLVGGEVVLPGAGVPLRVLEPRARAHRAARPLGRRERPHRPNSAYRRWHRGAGPLRKTVRPHVGRDARRRKPGPALSRLQQLGSALRRPRVQPAGARPLGVRRQRDRPLPRGVGTRLLPVLRAPSGEHPRRADPNGQPAHSRPIRHCSQDADHTACGADQARAFGHVARRRLERSGGVRLRRGGRRL